MLEQQVKRTRELTSCNILGPVATDYTSSNTGSWRIERPVVDFENCIKCSICEKYCPPNIITIEKNKKECVFIDYYYCKGCGICVNECPKHCIAMVNERSVK